MLAVDNDASERVVARRPRARLLRQSGKISLSSERRGQTTLCSDESLFSGVQDELRRVLLPAAAPWPRQLYDSSKFWFGFAVDIGIAPF